MTTKMIPDYEVRAFLDEVAPGLSNTKIGALLGVHRNTVKRWVDDGMPVPQARLLLALRMAELASQRRVHEIKAAEILKESDQLSEMMDQYKL